MLELVKAFVNDYSITEYTGFLIAIVLTFMGLVKYALEKLETKKNEIIEKHLINTETINTHTSNLNKDTQHNPSLYKSLLEDVLNYLTKILGNLKLFNYKTFDRHFSYSLIYSFFFFYIVWFFGGNGTIGLNLLISDSNRLSISLFFIFEILFFIYLAKNISLNKENTWSISSWKANKALLILILVISLFLIFGGIIYGKIIIVGSISILVFLMLEKKILIFKELKVVFFLLIFLSIIGVGLNSHNHYLPYLLFFLILPLTNAIFDYISMYFSRFFAQKILKTHSKLKIIIDAFLDLLVALILLYLLAETLYYVLELSNLYLIKDKVLFIPIETYRTQILINPFNKDVLWITLMFISTLIPTILHLFLATYALLAYWLTKPQLHDLVAKLNTLEANDPNYLKKEEIAKGLVRYRLSGMIKIYLLIGTSLLLLFFTALFMLLLKKGLYVI